MGYVILSGASKGMTRPAFDVLASSLSIGTTVKLMEGGTAVEYLVVNQGIPENSSLYDASCDGTWLLRKDCHSRRQWNTSDVNTYASSAINTWLNGDFFNSLGSVEQSAIKQVKIPYRKNGGYDGSDQSGANGLLCKIFLLSGYEIGLTTSDDSYLPVDGAKMSYFESGIGSSALNKRIAHLNGSAADWWLRSPYTFNAGDVWNVLTNGGDSYYKASYSYYGIRPAVILPGNALFDKSTMLLKGVA